MKNLLIKKYKKIMTIKKKNMIHLEIIKVYIKQFYKTKITIR